MREFLSAVEEHWFASILLGLLILLIVDTIANAIKYRK